MFCGHSLMRPFYCNIHGLPVMRWALVGTVRGQRLSALAIFGRQGLVDGDVFFRDPRLMGPMMKHHEALLFKTGHLGLGIRTLLTKFVMHLVCLTVCIFDSCDWVFRANHLQHWATSVTASPGKPWLGLQVVCEGSWFYFVILVPILPNSNRALVDGPMVGWGMGVQW